MIVVWYGHFVVVWFPTSWLLNLISSAGGVSWHCCKANTWAWFQREDIFGASSRVEECKRTVHNQNFTDDATTTGLIKNGEWMSLSITEFTLGDLKDVVVDTYFLDDDTKEWIVIRHYIPVVGDGEQKAVKYIADDDALIPSANRLHQDGYTLMIKYNGRKNNEEGDTREVDVSCDSRSMQDIIPKVGKEICNAYHWVPTDHPIFLFLDNAGGHGMKDVVDTYIKGLEDDFNVICIKQRSHLPGSTLEFRWHFKTWWRSCTSVSVLKWKPWSTRPTMHGIRLSQSNWRMYATSGKWSSIWLSRTGAAMER